MDQTTKVDDALRPAFRVIGSERTKRTYIWAYGPTTWGARGVEPPELI